MWIIQGEDKMIASSHHSDIAARASAPRRCEGRPRKPFVLLLSGLILIGVAAPHMADMAYGMPAMGHEGTGMQMIPSQPANPTPTPTCLSPMKSVDPVGSMSRPSAGCADPNPHGRPYPMKPIETLGPGMQMVPF